ncbi:MAG: 2-oxoacid:acceptor oxidoreductase subunit alpha, partial [Gammaproteobacteria bacterium]|nr:2-oxoacid:acceptor oxidoreductase subunit alpha [Gammaproteobacteria bacterium]
AAYANVCDELTATGYRLHEVPMEAECVKFVPDPRRGKNMFALGMLCSIYCMDLEMAREQVRFTFRKKDEKVTLRNIELLEAGWNWAEANLGVKFSIPATRPKEPQIVVNGNTALALGVVAS